LDEYFIPSNVRLASDPAAEPEPEPEPEPDEPEPESEPVPEKNTFRELWQSTWQRIVNKEVGSLRKALKKPDKFDEFMFDFYSKHKDYVAELIEPVVRGCLPGVDAKMRAIDIATEYVSDRVGLIEKSEDVAITLSNWQSSLPVIMTARMETQDA